MIYLDNSATTRVCPEAAAAVLDAMTTQFGNPSSLHTLGFAAAQLLAGARRAVARALGAPPETVTFTSGGTEANNLALFGAAAARRKEGRRIVTSMAEHPSVLRVMDELEREGWEVARLRPDRQGRLSPEQVEEAVTPDTALVSLMLVNNETGAVFPVEAAARALRRQNPRGLLHVDAVQAFGKLPLRPAALGAHLVTVSAHKIHGPKGVGALYCAPGVRIPPRTFGGGQERGLRPGTEGVPLIAGFGAAVQALPDLPAALERQRALNRLCREGLRELPGVTVHSPEDGLPYLLNFSAGDVRAETMLHFLAAREIYLSSGSACSRAQPSHVLTAMGLPANEVQSALRVSFSRETTEEDVRRFLEALGEGLQTLARRPARGAGMRRRSI